MPVPTRVAVRRLRAIALLALAVAALATGSAARAAGPPAGTYDAGFAAAYGGGLDGRIETVLFDGSGVIVSGPFTSYTKGGQVIDAPGVARFSSDGSLDESFTRNYANATKAISGYVSASIYHIALQPDGKLVVAGEIYIANSKSTGQLRRLNTDGTLDPTFATASFADDGSVYIDEVAVVGTDIVIGGYFAGRAYGGSTLPGNLARFSATGVLDTAFPAAAFDDGVWAIRPQSDGKIVVAGNFTAFSGNPKATRIARLNADGTLDTAFSDAYAASTAGGLNGTAWTLALDGDGRILVGGDFTQDGGGFGGVARIARFAADGTLDSRFAGTYAGALNGAVLSIAVDGDGRIMVGGSFTAFGIDARANRLARLEPSGALDAGFASAYAASGGGLNDTVASIAYRPADGAIVAGGRFTTYSGSGAPDANANRLARFAGTPTPTPPPSDGGGAGGGSTATPGGTAPTAARTSSVTMRTARVVRGSSIRTQVVVSGPGRIAVRGTLAGRAAGASVCSATRVVKRAGTYTLTCRLARHVRALRATRPVRLVVTTTFTPDGGTATTASRTIALKRVAR